MRRRIVKELQHERVAFERLLHDAALHAYAPAMDEPHFAEPRYVRLRHILLDDRGDVARCESVEVQRAFDGNLKGLALSGVEGVLILHFVSSGGRGVSRVRPTACRNGR